MSISPRPEIRALTEAAHGTADLLELRDRNLDADSILDFAVNVLSDGLAPATADSLRRLPADVYPDRESTELRRALANRLGLSLEQLIAGNGSGELLWMLALAFVRPQDPVVIVGPTYAEYERCGRMMGAACTRVDADEPDFAIPTADVTEKCRVLGPRLVFVCNPNNPTGQYLSPEVIQAWAAEFPRTLFVIDEAFIEFVVGARSLATTLQPNLAVLRSLSKAYGIAGLRLGFLAGDASLVEILRRVRPPWNVNAAAQSAGVAAVSAVDHLAGRVREHAAWKELFVSQLVRIGLEPVPSAAPFLMLRVGDARQVREALLVRNRILVRDCGSFGLPNYIRVAVRRPPENQRLVESLAAMAAARELFFRKNE